MGLFEPITHKEEIERTLSRAQSVQNDSIERFNRAKTDAENKLSKYGETKLKVYNDSLATFLVYFNSFKNVEMKQLSLAENQLINLDSGQALTLIKEDVQYTKDMIKIGLTAAGAGALTGIAAYGGLKAAGIVGAKFAGAAAAKTIGVKAAVVAPFVFVPVLIVFGIGAAIKGKERLAEAKKQLQQAELEASKTNSYTIVFQAISRGVSNYDSFVKSFNKKYQNIVKRVGEISKEHQKDVDGKIDFESLNEVDQKTLHLSWLMTQLIYGILKQPLIDGEGKISTESQDKLVEYKKEVKTIESKYRVKVSNHTWNPKKAARGWLVGCFVVFGTSLLLYLYYKYIKSQNAALLMLANSVVAFPFSIFIRKMPFKFKAFLRIFRFVLCLIALLLIVYYGTKM